MPLLYVWALGFAGFFISAVGAWFSVTGLAALFSGAGFAVGMMAAGLEFAKLVMAGYLYRAWGRLNFFLRYYMLGSVLVLSMITSIGIFGFLSNAYQRSTFDLDAQQIKIAAFDDELKRAQEEMRRIRELIDQVPVNRISKKIALQKEMEPRLAELVQRQEKIAQEKRELNLQVLTTNTKVGPLIFVAKAFNIPIDQVVKWLITLFVGVFDPLALCLVVATTASVQWREEDRKKLQAAPMGGTHNPAPVGKVRPTAPASTSNLSTPSFGPVLAPVLHVASYTAAPVTHAYSGSHALAEQPEMPQPPSPEPVIQEEPKSEIKTFEANMDYVDSETEEKKKS